MADAMKIPVYTVYIVSGTTKYNVTPALVAIDRSEDKGQIAQSVTIQLQNVQVDGAYLSDLLKARDRIFVHANDGTDKGEVFRGFLWTRKNKESLGDKDLQYKSYDNLIYTQESEDSVFFSSGKSTKDVCASMCDKWGISLKYSYESITHGKLVLRGKLADIFKADILDLVKERTGKKYVLRSDQDTMYIMPVGANTTIYHFLGGKNVIGTTSGWTMDGVITKVVILGKADSDEREPVEATVSGDTDKYGTLQKIIDRNSDTSLADAKLEAKNIIDEYGKPKWEYELTAPDIPWIRNGDKVYVDAGDMKGYKIVTAINRSSDNQKSEMTLTMEDP